MDQWVETLATVTPASGPGPIGERGSGLTSRLPERLAKGLAFLDGVLERQEREKKPEVIVFETYKTPITKHATKYINEMTTWQLLDNKNSYLVNEQPTKRLVIIAPSYEEIVVIIQLTVLKPMQLQCCTYTHIVHSFIILTRK